jgi:uncharacterized membrane protein YhaH (DUF805 family)
MNMQQAIQSVFRQYASASGRARRSEYWWWTLAAFLGYVVLYVLMLAVSRVFGVLVAIYGLALVVPSVALGIRRLHDTGRSGWWLLFSFVPFVGGITVFVFQCLDSTPGTNRFGPSPKGGYGDGPQPYGSYGS